MRALGTKHGLYTTERVAGGGNPIGLYKGLVLQPFERRKLIREQSSGCRRGPRLTEGG